MILAKKRKATASKLGAVRFNQPAELLANLNTCQTHFKLSIADRVFALSLDRPELQKTLAVDWKAKTEDFLDRPLGFILLERPSFLTICQGHCQG